MNQAVALICHVESYNRLNSSWYCVSMSVSQFPQQSYIERPPLKIVLPLARTGIEPVRPVGVPGF